jgi:hypothetical protein
VETEAHQLLNLLNLLKLLKHLLTMHLLKKVTLDTVLNRTTLLNAHQDVVTKVNAISEKFALVLTKIAGQCFVPGWSRKLGTSKIDYKPLCGGEKTWVLFAHMQPPFGMAVGCFIWQIFRIFVDRQSHLQPLDGPLPDCFSQVFNAAKPLKAANAQHILLALEHDEKASVSKDHQHVKHISPVNQRIAAINAVVQIGTLSRA